MQTTTYDRRGHVAQVTNAAGGFQQTTYDSMGRPAQTTDSDGVSMGYSYDLAGQPLEQTKPRSTSDYDLPDYDLDRTTYTYDADGRMTSTVDPRGNVTFANPEDFTTTVTYDADGRPVSSTDPLGRTVTTGYDAVGRPVTVTDVAGNVTTTAYNAVGWPTSVTAPGQGKTRYYYDKVGNLTKRLDPMSRATLYTYDAAGRLLTQTDALGRVTAMSYDAVGNVAQVVKPSGSATHDDPTDGMASYAYDAANRVVSMSFSDATAGFTYDYSAAGRLLLAARVQGPDVVASSTSTYDASGRKTSVVRTGPGGGDANYSYTSAGRLSGAAWSTGLSEAYSYNTAGELTEVTPSGVGNMGVVEYGYDPSGRVSSVTRNGVSTPTTTAVIYDAAGQVASLEHASGATVVDGYAITRDVRGNPTEVTTTTPGGSSSALYGYDTVSRLTSECYPSVGVVCTSTSPRSSYTYDKVGNRTSESARTVVGSKATTVKTVYAYDAAHQLLTQSVAGVATVTNTWSLNGALATSTTPAGTKTYTSDLTDELVSLTLEDDSVVGYTHDAQGNRTSRLVDGVTDVSWAWDELSSLPVRTGEYDAAGALSTVWLPDPTSSTGSPLADSSGGVASWMLSDPFANTVASVSMTGTVSGTKTLNAFGVVRTTATGTMADSPVGFAGQYLDDATGLYDMRARDYDPTSGRFNATDPVQVPTGMPYVDGYSYAFNNPLMFTDPSGLTACGPIGSDCNGANLVTVFSRLARELNDTAYLNLYNSLTKEQISQIPSTDLQDIAAGAQDRQMHQMACEDSPGACLPACPEEGYQRCQLERDTEFAVFYVAPLLLGMGASALAGRACVAADAAAASRTAAASSGAAPALPGAAKILNGNSKWGLQHILERHAFNSVTAKPASKFASNFGLSDISQAIKDAIARGGPWKAEGSSRVLDTSVGRTVGTDLAGKTTTGLRVVTDANGVVITSYPIPWP